MDTHGERHRTRTYHNTAILLPTGQVLIGGHAPISTLDSYNTTLPGGFTDGFRNPSFEIYNPPYMYWGPQPRITSVSGNFARGASVTVTTPDATNIGSVVLVRNTALTHLVDGDQRPSNCRSRRGRRAACRWKSRPRPRCFHRVRTCCS